MSGFRPNYPETIYPVTFSEHPNSEKDRNLLDFATPDVSLYQEFIRAAEVEFSQIATIPFIDISKWNLGGDFDVMVLAGWEIVIIKASEALVSDPVFPAHVKAAIEAGALILVYHFFRSNVDGLAQANSCLGIINPMLAPYQNKTLVLCDIETADGVSNSLRIQRVKAFLDRIVAAGHEAGMYCSPALWTSLMSPTPSWTNQFWQWCAHWVNAPLPTLPVGWTAVKTIFWQIGIWNNYPWCPAVPGWNPDLDVNRAFFGTRQELMNKLGIVFISQPPDPVPPVNVLTYSVKTATLNVRSGPGANYPIVGAALLNGDIITALDVKPISVNGVWVKHGISPDKWSAMVSGGVQYLERTP